MSQGFLLKLIMNWSIVTEHFKVESKRKENEMFINKSTNFLICF